jgi:hypothetical protein
MSSFDFLKAQHCLLSALVASIVSQNLAFAKTTSTPPGVELHHNMSLLASTEAPGELEKSLSSDVDLSPGAHEVALLTGILPLYQRLQSEQKKAALSNSSADDLDSIRRQQRIIYLHAYIGQCLQTMECELRRSMARIDSESADLSDLKASLADERARVQHRTSIANMVSGGATRIGAYTTGLATPNTLPINLLEIFDGIVQIGLSSVMIRQERKEHRSDKTSTETITVFAASGKTNPPDYPQAVWDYLNHPLPGRKDGKSRRQLVIEDWSSMGRIAESTSGTSASAAEPTPVIRLRRSPEHSLDVTLSMMADIKAALSSMEASIAELSEALKNSYANDPQI